MLPDLCRWHRLDKVDSTEIIRSLAVARIQSNFNPFIFDPSLAERCYCASYPDKLIKIYGVNIFPNPSKGLFYIDFPDYKGPLIMKISNASGKLLETHHLMYSGLITWRLGTGLWKLSFSIVNKHDLIYMVMIQ